MSTKNKDRMREMMTTAPEEEKSSSEDSQSEETVGERHRRKHQEASSGGEKTSDSLVPHWPEDPEVQEHIRQVDREEDTYPKKVGQNMWLHGDGYLYKKMMFVVRYDQSKALDSLLSEDKLIHIGSNRSEVVRGLLDDADIRLEPDSQ